LTDTSLIISLKADESAKYYTHLSNAYDEHGEKHDDRVGDAYILGIILGFGGAALLKTLGDERASLAETA
jgi:hypothetical protein